MVKRFGLKVASALFAVSLFVGVAGTAFAANDTNTTPGTVVKPTSGVPGVKPLGYLYVGGGVKPTR